MENPIYTIVLPVRNGGAHLKLCVSSILAQSAEIFELVVLENCSDDGSAEWLAELRDPRVRIYPASEPLSMMDNWARAVEIPKREFVTFIGHDDLLDPNYLEVMDALIAAHPDAGLYHAHFRFIDGRGGNIGSCRPMPTRETDAQFCRKFLLGERDANGTGYVMRSRDFERAGGFPHFHKMLYADHALWLNMVRDSCIVTAPEECFAYRMHSTSTTASSRWSDHLEAMKQLVNFLVEAKGWNEEMARVIEEYAPLYFFRWCNNWYSYAIVEATKQNRRIEPQILDEFVAILQEMASQEVKGFKNLKTLRLRHYINAFPVTRMAYIFYIRSRYGKSALPYAPRNA